MVKVAVYTSLACVLLSISVMHGIVCVQTLDNKEIYLEHNVETGYKQHAAFHCHLRRNHSLKK